MRKQRIRIFLAVMSLYLAGLACDSVGDKVIKDGAICEVTKVDGLKASSYKCTCYNGIDQGKTFSGHEAKILQVCPAAETCPDNFVLEKGLCKESLAAPGAQTVICKSNEIIQDGACVACPEGQTANDVTNQCEAAAEPPTQPPAEPPAPNISLSTLKTAEPAVVGSIDQLVKYTVVVTNDGDTPVEVEIVDYSMEGSEMNSVFPGIILDPGESFTWEYWLNMSFPSAKQGGKFGNCAQARAFVDGKYVFASEQSCATVEYPQPVKGEREGEEPVEEIPDPCGPGVWDPNC